MAFVEVIKNDINVSWADYTQLTSLKQSYS